jgi:hypothetical protein
VFDSLRSSLTTAVVLTLAAFLVSCSDAGGDSPDDIDVADVQDTPDIVVDIERDVTPPDVQEDTGVSPESLVCLPCEVALDCGAGNFCLEGYPDGNTYCAFSCGGSNRDLCPEGTTCRDLDAIGLQAACVPDVLAECPCVGLDCAEGQICDPTLGLCSLPRELCDDCTVSEQCGGPNDLCLTYTLTGGGAESVCATECTTAADCGDGYSCLPVNLGDDVTAEMCIPDIRTCTDRCEDVTCEEDFRCNPLDGRCEPQGQVCDRCASDAECGGLQDRCLGLRGADCTQNRDCAVGENCLTDPDTGDQFCQGGYCGAVCNPQLGLVSTCPAETVCFRVGDDPAEGQCLPLRLSCVDRCSAVECDEGFNCDDTTGECVRATTDYCNPCDSTPGCGEYDDICLNLSGERRCLPSCDGENVCPLGYQCRLNISSNMYCVPANREAECVDCTETDCPNGESCYALGGACLPDPVACEEGGDVCPTGEVCSRSERRCMPIGLPCTLDSAFFYCDASLFGCTAATDELIGSCEQSCRSFGRCEAARPYCLNLHGALTDVCVSDVDGGADTCGRVMPVTESIGRPCVVLDDPSDPGICPSEDTDICLEGVDPNVPGFCTRRCETDDDCGTAACQVFEDGGFCVPPQCECLLDPVLADGEADLVGDLLADAGTSRCGIAWTLTERRRVTSVLAAESAYTSVIAASTVADPLSLAQALSTELAQTAENTTAMGAALASLDIAAAAWGIEIDEERLPVVARENGVLLDALRALTVALDSDSLTPEDVTALERVPVDTQIALAELIVSLIELVGVHQEVVVPIVGRSGALTFEDLATLFLPGESSASPADFDVQQVLTGAPFRQALLVVGARAMQALARLPDDLEPTATPIEVRLVTPIGLVILSSGTNNIWEFDEPPALLIDLDGDDTYLGHYAANAGVDQPFSVVLDASGSDTYGYQEVPTDDDPEGYPADAAGRAAADGLGNGPVTNSMVRSQGSGFFGVGALVDLGPGADTYEALRFAQGFGLAGVGVFIDQSAELTMRVEAAGQGAAIGGIGIASTGNAVVTANAFHLAQGAAGPGGVGVFTTGSGSANYTLESSDDTLYAASFVLSPGNVSVGQGAGVGVRQGDGVAGYPVGGGVGVLIDRGGDDRYSAGMLAQGAATRLGLGVLYDADGNDTYDGQELVMGAGLAGGLGLLRDISGDDNFGYVVTADVAVQGRRATRAAGFGEDLGVGVLWDLAGNDQHYQGQFTLGLGRINGFGLFADADGDDAYDADANEGLGEATLTIFGSEPDANPRRLLGTFGFFLDGGGRDEYARPDLLNPPLGDEQRWLQTSRDEAGLPVFGGGIDAQGALPL